LIWAAIAAYLGVALSFTEKMESAIKVDRIIVEIVDSLNYKFIKSEDVFSRLEDYNFEIQGKNADSVNRSAIRSAIYDMEEVKDVNVFFTHESTLKIKVWQRMPVVRIRSGQMDYYLDEDNKIFNFRLGFSPKVMLITGSVEPQYAREELFPMVKYIQQDKFLNSVIEGIYVDDKHRLELIQRIGNQRVFFGEADNYEWKLTKLVTFYEKAMPNIGWDKYDSIHLGFGDQVVCKNMNSNE
jgi:cell division protein FtsQ